jgi:hypothetical protein
MNKLKVTIAGLLVACLGIGVIKAQDNTTTKPAPKTTTSKASAKTSAATPTSAQHLKKDGTPDMRYKENKAAAGKSTSTTAKPGAPATKKTTTKKATAPSTTPDNTSGK